MTKGKATVVHVLYWPVERRATNMDIIEDTIPLYNVKLSVALPHLPATNSKDQLAGKPAKAYLAPSRQPLEFTYANGRAEVVVPEIRGHQMVVFE